ncbi:hypothetical protein CC86DRAFT_366189 [Ophiobolus disseminans]|uniref:Uncharacterized protein n=1 Tax=Ophiobolus disseminans TaxID=1469910 RepID=A0A6A7AGE7_9PLEO|nr:hypothetical protein CC86DRAFT_366189 [Ophiobolus disseminans]
MVSTRNRARAPAGSPRDAAAAGDVNTVPPTPSTSRTRRRRNVTRATTTTSTSTTVATSSTVRVPATGGRRTRSQVTQSPLTSLDDESAQRAVSRAAPSRSTTARSTTPEPPSTAPEPTTPESTTPAIQASATSATEESASPANKRKRDSPRQDTASSSAARNSKTVESEPAQAQSNGTPQNYEYYGLAVPEHIPHERGLIGNEAALALLRRIENHGKPTTGLPHDTYNDSESEYGVHTSSQQSSRPTAGGETPRGAANATPPRVISTPSSFLSRSLSALKSTFGFATPLPAPAPAPVPSRAPPPPGTFTETLSTPPTPVGERPTAERVAGNREVKRRGRRINLSPMYRLLTTDVPISQMIAANGWAKEVTATLMNDPAFEAKRQRLETPVLLKDLDSYPSCEPWASGFGDPLGFLDDDDVVPVWAVYLDMLAEAEQPGKKKSKTTHEDDMDVEDTPSLNDTFGPEPTTPFASHDTSASIMALNPRPSREPSPMFASGASPHQGDNIFRKSHDSDVDAPSAATKKSTPHHNPAQGSYGLDSDSDDDDSVMSNDASEADAGAAPLWTQPPPPAPTPAHAPLPGGLVGESAGQPVDEVERQRQKLMKHTPAKPSRLREAFVPSPSLLSDAGNDSILFGTPLAGGDLFGDMPDADELELDDDVLANVAALTETGEWKTRAAEPWATPMLTYESEEEALSPVDAE